MYDTHSPNIRVTRLLSHEQDNLYPCMACMASRQSSSPFNM